MRLSSGNGSTAPGKNSGLHAPYTGQYRPTSDQIRHPNGDAPHEPSRLTGVLPSGQSCSILPHCSEAAT